MSAKVIAFPLSRRRDLIRRQAVWFARQTARAAEANLFHHLQVQRDALLSKGVDAAEVEREARALEGEIRAEVWRLVITPEASA